VSYVAHTPDDVARMLQQVGASSIDELFAAIPESLYGNAELKLERELGERSLLGLLGTLAERNRSCERNASFLGGGAYHHFIPAAVPALASRGEFLTAYTPYQAEISQGTLQAIFEFQTLMCQLTGQEVANASMYDGASATAESALLALRQTKRRRLLVSAGLHPHYLGVLRTYTSDVDVEIEELPLGADGRTAPCEIPDSAAAVILQQPNFFGCIERLEPFAESAHRAGALLATATPEPLALALLRPPGAAGADLSCGEAQSFGVPLSFGGPYVGFLAARQSFVRQLPGRLVGETLDSEGARAFVMTLTTREQHIRRERATSNICTNQGLCALRVTIYLSLLGKQGLRKLAQINLSLAEYAKSKLAEVGVRTLYSAPTFNEFVVKVPGLSQRLAALGDAGILPGLPLESFAAERRDQLLVCTTEMTSREQIDRLAEALAS
jgi:glycine dehydrogenase subunit 1